MRYPFFLAKRLTLSSEGHKGAPAIRVAITAVALSVAVMIAAVAIVLGFKREITGKLTGFNSHISLTVVPEYEGETNLITLTSTLKKILDSKPYVTDYSLNASIPAILKTPDNFKGVYLNNLKGAETERFMSSNLEEGKLPDFSKEENKNKIAISRLTANALNLKVGDKIDTYFLLGDIRVRRFEIAAIFNSHFDSYDNNFIYGPLSVIQDLGDVERSQGTSVSIHTNDFGRVEAYTSDLRQTLQEALAKGVVYKNYEVTNARELEARYFQWLALLDTNVVVILTLMTIVACVTLISGMLIIILDKKRFIGLIRALGAPIGGVRKVFILLALRVALSGMAIGNIVMVGLLWIQQRYHLIHLDPEAYYIDFVPVEINWSSILILNGITFGIIYLCLILPSRFVSQISPTETMRTE